MNFLKSIAKCIGGQVRKKINNDVTHFLFFVFLVY